MILSMGNLVLRFTQGPDACLNHTILDTILEIRSLLTDTDGITNGTSELLGRREHVINASRL